MRYVFKVEEAAWPGGQRVGLAIQRSRVVGFHMTSLKFKLEKISILPGFYFHDALELLKTNFHTNFRFKRVLGFVMEYA